MVVLSSYVAIARGYQLTTKSMNQNNLTDLDNLKNLKYRSSVLMPDRDGIFDVVFSDTDRDCVKNLSYRLRELGYETVIHSEAFWNGYWEHEIDVIDDIEWAKIRYPSQKI